MKRMIGWVGLGSWILLLAVVLTGAAHQDFFAGLVSGSGLLGLVAMVLLMAMVIGAMVMTSLLCQALWPVQVGRNRVRLQQFPTRCALAGCLVLCLQAWVLSISPAAVHGPLYVLWLIWDGLAAAQGFPALAALHGERVAGVTGPRATAVGTALFACGGSLPVVGWCLAAGCLLQAVGTNFLPVVRS